MSGPKNPYDQYLKMRGDILKSKVVAQFAPMTFLENLTIDAAGDVVMTSLLDGRIWRVPFGGQAELLCQIDGRPSGISPAPDGGWLVFGWTAKQTVAVFLIRPTGSWEIFLEVPKAVFPNGAQRIGNGHYLFNDSILGVIWDVDFYGRSVNPWYTHKLFMPKLGAWAPALNGMKVWQDKLYVSNAATRQILAITVRDGKPEGDVTVVKDEIDADDFAFDLHGNLYVTTHPHDVVLKLTPEGKVSRSAGPEEGVRGCPACRFGRRPGDETGLYVISDGGLFNPLSGGLKPAQLVRLETGVAGAQVDPF